MTHMRRRGILLAAVVATIVVGVWTVPRIGVPGRFWLVPLETVSVAGRDLRVARVTYAQGLREVETLGTLDAALFVLDEPASAEAGMGMDGTRMPLDVVFFDPGGRFLVRHTMPVCAADDCPGYFPTAAWQFAIEGPAGSLSWIPADAHLAR
jgi:uncharacterized membrane protein (UPF0127 family)